MKKILASLLILIIPSLTFGAIALDSKSYYNAVQTWGNLGTSATLSHTVTGTNPVLVCTVQTADTGDSSTGVNYNSVAMTQGIKAVTADSSSYYTYLYYLVNPATGTHDAVATFSSSEAHGQFSCSSFTGAGTPEAFASATHATGVGDTVILDPITTLTDNAWVVGAIGVFSGAKVTASVGTTMSRGNNVSFWDTADSNGAKSPAGSYSIAGVSSGGGWTAIALSLPVYVASAVIPPQNNNLVLFGDW